MFELIIIGLFIGFIVSMIGLAGGVFFIPLLVLFYGIEPASAVGISLFAMLGVTLASSISYFLQKKVDIKLSLLYNLFDIPGVMIGAILTVIIASNLLLLFCGLIILVMGISLLFYEQLKLNRKNKKRKIKEYFFASISSLFGGLITGLCGMGGGTTDTTTMILFGVPISTAVASSEFAMLLTNIVGLLVHGYLGNIDYAIALPLFIGSIFGAIIGPYYSKRVKTNTLRKLLAFFVLFLGLRLILF